MKCFLSSKFVEFVDMIEWNGGERVAYHFRMSAPGGGNIAKFSAPGGG